MSRQTDFNAAAQDYYSAQVDISESLLERVMSWWRGLSPQRAAEGSSAVVREFQTLVRPARDRSYSEGMRYHNAAREVAIGEPAPDDVWDGRDMAAEAEYAKTSYYVHTAPLRKEIQRGRLDDPDFLKSLDETMASAGRNLALEAGRIAEQGGRDALAEARENDAEVIGWYRKTDADPCGFCAMIASRGAAYSEYMEPDQFHRGCHCQTLPLFRGVEIPAEDAAMRDEYLARWNATPGSGADQLKTFQQEFNAERKQRREAAGQDALGDE